MKDIIVLYHSVKNAYLGKFWFPGYGPKSRPIRLQHSLIPYISVRNWCLILIFCMKIVIHERKRLSILLCVVHAQACPGMPNFAQNRVWGLFRNIESLVLTGNGLKWKILWFSIFLRKPHVQKNSGFQFMVQKRVKVGGAVGWIGSRMLLSQNWLFRFFLTFCMKLGDYKWWKVIETEFSGKFWFSRNLGKTVPKWPRNGPF